jgi:2-keto-4-pentenoate hydratase/2-oxohepta-3-ene-1,7-dioic acid hydratase in catechol pathway
VKLCTFEVATSLGRHRRLGAFHGTGIVDLNFGCAWHLARKGEVRPYTLADVLVPDNMLAFLQGEKTSMGFARATLEDISKAFAQGEPLIGPNQETLLYSAGAVTLRAPLPRPPSIRDFSPIEEHVKRGNVIGPGEDVLWPSFTEKFDYGLELAAVIGTSCRNVPAANARPCIAGFMVMNDFSARDIQRKEMKVRPGPAKGKDWCTALGPVLVTPDEIGNPYDLRMTAHVNGELWSEGNSETMHWTFEEMIEFVSKDESLSPGDVLGSGTFGGGCGRDLDRWVKPGELMELRIEKIGCLDNRVVKRDYA